VDDSKYTILQKLKSFFFWLPRRIGLKILPKHKYARTVRNTFGTSVGLETAEGRLILYGKEHYELYWTGQIE